MPSPRLSVSQYTVLTSPIPRGLDLLARTGIPGIEIFMEGPDWWDPGILHRIAQARGMFSGPLSVHPPAWDINIASYTKPVRDMSIEVYGQSIEWTRYLGGTYVVLHVGWRGTLELPRTECLVRAEQAIRALASRARDAGIALAVENVGWFGQEICDQTEFAELIWRLPAGVGALLDVGHALLAGWDIPAAARVLAPRMVAMHLHDNDGRSDQHLPIGQGRIDWETLLPLLPDMPEGCHFILEYAPGTPLESVRQGGEQVDRLLNG